MVRRTYWLSAIEALWREKSIVWLSGVRRAGKTFLCQSLPDSEYLDCELPSTRRALAADYYPATQIVATGSSSLGALRRFRDTLTDRKRDLTAAGLLLGPPPSPQRSSGGMFEATYY